jgi:Late competence development protein ComFB
MVGMARKRTSSKMSLDFSSIHNHHEQAVFDAVDAQAAQFPLVARQPELLADVACIALNRLPPRYIRHSIDYSFYLSDGERERDEKAMAEAVIYAFGYVQARSAMRARG